MENAKMPKCTHILQSGVVLTAEEFAEWVKTHKVPLANPIYEVLGLHKRKIAAHVGEQVRVRKVSIRDD